MNEDELLDMITEELNLTVKRSQNSDDAILYTKEFTDGALMTLGNLCVRIFSTAIKSDVREKANDLHVKISEITRERV